MEQAEVETIEQFAACWEGLEDPRCGNAKLYDLYELLLIALGCVLCGGQRAVDMALFAQTKEPFLRNFLNLSNGVPSTTVVTKWQEEASFVFCSDRTWRSTGVACASQTSEESVPNRALRWRARY
jgi:hypothetical protein